MGKEGGRVERGGGVGEECDSDFGTVEVVFSCFP